jgi:UDP-N-acetylmuramate dehydrogenase
MVASKMKILKNVSLKLYSTMRLGGTADYLCEAKKPQDLVTANAWAEAQQIPLRVIGGGSNIIWRDEGFKGLLVINKIPGFRLVSEDAVSATYKVGAGENWDTIVDQFVGLGLSGVEALSLIPGTVGAGPIQNIGAYGQDIAQTLVEVEAYDLMEKAFVIIKNSDCAFGYRTSRFKTVDSGRFLIATVSFCLSKQGYKGALYADVKTYLDQHEVSRPTPKAVRNAVVAIRSKKLPNPTEVANCGSFFSNPVISNIEFKKLVKRYPEIKKTKPGWPQKAYWELDDGSVKISAGWLIETAGFSGHKDHQTGMSLWPKQNLVVVNQKAKKTQDLLDFEQKLTSTIFAKFDINLQREPEILP